MATEKSSFGEGISGPRWTLESIRNINNPALQQRLIAELGLSDFKENCQKIRSQDKNWLPGLDRRNQKLPRFINWRP